MPPPQKDFTPIISRRTRRASVVILLRVRPDKHPLALSPSPPELPHGVQPSPYQGVGPRICGAFFKKREPQAPETRKIPKFAKDDDHEWFPSDTAKPLPDLSSPEFTDPESILLSHLPEGGIKGQLDVEKWIQQVSVVSDTYI